MEVMILKIRNNSAQYMKGKGFYAVLAFSIATIGGATWLGIDSAIEQFEVLPEVEQTPQDITNEYEWTLPEIEIYEDTPVEIKQDNIIKEETSKDETEKTSDTEAAPAETQTQTAVQQGYILPLSGDIINPYSGDKVVKSKTLDEWVMHTGVDIGAEIDTPVKSISGGTVLSIENDDLWGTTIIIEHQDGITSHYSSLKSAVTVTVNQTVKLGDVIGHVAESCPIEAAEDPHLHFGVKKDGEWIDPFSIID